jgi:hypothetical protein
MRGRNACGLVVGYRFFGRQRPGQPVGIFPSYPICGPLKFVLHPRSGDTHRVGGSLHSKTIVWRERWQEDYTEGAVLMAHQLRI